MENCKLMFDLNRTNNYDKQIRKKIKFNNNEKRYYYKISVNDFTGDEIYEIICVINYIWSKLKQKVPITFDLGKTKFSDKLVYIILESLFYYMYKVVKHDVKIIFEAKHTIWSEGIRYSPLRDTVNTDKFIKLYEKNISLHHFRRLVPNIENREPEYLSKLMQDIKGFLNNNALKEEVSDQLAEAIIELIGNAGEHGNSECVVDIDITETEYFKEDDESNQNYYGMNVVVLNFSPILFFEPLRNKIKEGNLLTDRYDYVLKAKDYHLNNLNDIYTENDFYTISSFQHKISGNMNKTKTGGTGLTSMLHSLEDNSDTHYCYILSGNKVLFFEKQLMLSDDNKLIGFNNDKNYLSNIPDMSLFTKIKTYVPGTAYNLNYAIKKEW